MNKGITLVPLSDTSIFILGTDIFLAPSFPSTNLTYGRRSSPSSILISNTLSAYLTGTCSTGMPNQWAITSTLAVANILLKLCLKPPVSVLKEVVGTSI